MNPQTNADEVAALFILARYCDSSAAARTLLQAHGSALAAVNAGHQAWREAGASAKACETLRRPDSNRIDQDLVWWQESTLHQVVAWQQDDYPALLRQVDNPPAVLFVMGDMDALWHPQIAMVGSRHASHTGKQIAHQFAQSFVQSGWAVTSGLAQGIDTAAHRGALGVEQTQHPATLAVVATGLDLVYPAGNEGLMQAIARRGAVISEHPPGTPPLKEHFPSRNRIIAGLSLGCVVVEAAQRSGALITARLANELGKEVFAIPGSIQNPMSRGCHQLIRQGAALIEQASEVTDLLSTHCGQLQEALRRRLNLDSSQGQKQLALTLSTKVHDDFIGKALGDAPSTLDQLCERTGLTASELSSMLLLMEMEGQIAQQEGRYVRLI